MSCRWRHYRRVLQEDELQQAIKRLETILG
jgi:hypothetical protein